MDTSLAEPTHDDVGEITSKEVHPDTEKLKLYDFRHPRLINKEVKKVLHKIHESFCKNLDLIFLSILGNQVQVRLKEIEEVIMADHISSLQSPAAVFLFNIEELGDWAIMDIDPAFCIYTVEKQSGSTNISISEGRTLTRIEERITMRMMKRIFSELCYAWAPYLSLTIQNFGYESKPTNIRTHSSSEAGVLVKYRLTVDDCSMALNFCYPFSLLREYGSSLGVAQPAHQKNPVTPRVNRKLEERIKEIELPIRAILGKTRMSMKDLVNISEGDTIKLNQLISEPLEVEINKTRKMKAFPGTIDGYRAIKIYEAPKK